MSRVRTSKRNKAVKRKEWPAVVFFWIMGLAILGYVIGRIALDSYPHPYHWLSGLMGGILGIGFGWVWYWKERGRFLDANDPKQRVKWLKHCILLLQGNFERGGSMRKIGFCLLVGIAALVVTACGAQTSYGVTPAPDKLTFLFFYTEN